MSVAGDTPLHDLVQRGEESVRLRRRNDSRQRLFDQLVGAKAEKREHGIVGLQDFSLEIRHEHGIGRVLDQALRVRPGFIQFAHVAENADGADDLPLRVAKGGRVERRGDALPTCAPWVEPGIARDAALYDFAQGCQKLARFSGRDDA